MGLGRSVGGLRVLLQAELVRRAPDVAGLRFRLQHPVGVGARAAKTRTGYRLNGVKTFVLDAQVAERMAALEQATRDFTTTLNQTPGLTAVFSLFNNGTPQIFKAGVLQSTRSPLYPQLNYQGSAARERFSEGGATGLPSGISNPTNAYQVLAGASWEIDLWGRIRRLSESAQATLFATEQARRGVSWSVKAMVAALREVGAGNVKIVPDIQVGSEGGVIGGLVLTRIVDKPRTNMPRMAA